MPLNPVLLTALEHEEYELSACYNKITSLYETLERDLTEKEKARCQPALDELRSAQPAVVAAARSIFEAVTFLRSVRL